MRLQKSARYFLHTAVILLALAGVGNMQSHSCLDGQEPAVSVHFENLNGHPEHLGDKAHLDIDNELMVQVLPNKVLDQDTLQFLSAVILQFNLLPPQRPYYSQVVSLIFRRAPSTFLPPLRAPPALPA